MKLSNLKTIVYVGLALFYLYIIATNVFRNVEGMTTTIETIENKKEGSVGDGDSTDADGKKEKKTESKKEGETNMGNSDSDAKPETKESTEKKKKEDKLVSKPMQSSTGKSSNEDK